MKYSRQYLVCVTSNNQTINNIPVIMLAAFQASLVEVHGLRTYLRHDIRQPCVICTICIVVAAFTQLSGLGIISPQACVAPGRLEVSAFTSHSNLRINQLGAGDQK